MKLIKTDRVICIDPGTTHSGVVVFDGLRVWRAWSAFENNHLLDYLLRTDIKEMVIEGIACYGMCVGETTFTTCEWIGRFRQGFGFGDTTKIFRKDAKIFLCHSMQAKDKNIRRRILDIFPATGGGRNPEIGIKSKRGPLYGVTEHAMAALAIGLTYKYGGEIWMK